MQVEYSWIPPVCHQYTTSIPPVLLQEIYLMSWSVVYPTGESSDERLILQVDNNANLLFGEDGIGYLVVLTKLRIEYGQSMRGLNKLRKKFKLRSSYLFIPKQGLMTTRDLTSTRSKRKGLTHGLTPIGKVQAQMEKVMLHTMSGPLVISWFVSLNNCSYKYHKL